MSYKITALQWVDTFGILQYILSIDVVEWSVTLVGLVIKGENENILLKFCVSRLLLMWGNTLTLKSPVI